MSTRIKMFRSWIRNWFLIDILALGTGATSTAPYIFFADQLPDTYTSFKDIWSNLGTEILGVWISVRVIDALIRAREERHRVRNNIAGNLNFMMEICQDIPPHFDSWRINDIGNELMWFNEKRTATIGSKQMGKFFSSEERAEIDEVLNRVTAVDTFAKQMQSIRVNVERLSESEFRWKSPAEIEELFKATRRFNHSDSGDDAEVSQWLAKVNRNLKLGNYTDDVAENVTELIDYVTQLVTQAAKVREAIADVETSLARLRRSISTDD